jgi:hypothetical protein
MLGMWVRVVRRNGRSFTFPRGEERCLSERIFRRVNHFASFVERAPRRRVVHLQRALVAARQSSGCAAVPGMSLQWRHRASSPGNKKALRIAPQGRILVVF